MERRICDRDAPGASGELCRIWIVIRVTCFRSLSETDAIVADVFSSEKRSAIMSRVRNKDTAAETYVRSSLHRAGFRFRKNEKSLPGSPDVVLPRYKMVIFVHGCFWHGHSCRRAKLPATNASTWRSKIEKNIRRDEQSVDRLSSLGWQVETIWTCQLKEATTALIAKLSRQRLEFDCSY